MAEAATAPMSLTDVGDDDLEKVTKSIKAPMPVDTTNLVPKLADIKEKEIREKERASGSMVGTMEQDRARMKKMLDQQSHLEGELKPWNADAEQAKYTTDPLQKFGSIGSIFAVAAAAFTHTPAISAMNGMAAAIKAIDANDDAAYQRAHEAWKENMDLVVKRHAMMHQDYQSARELFETDHALGRIKTQEIATKYGDKTTLELLRAGFDPKVFEIQEAQNKAAEQWLDLQPKAQAELDKRFLENKIKNMDPRFHSPDPKVKAQAESDMRSITGTLPEQQRGAAVATYIEDINKGMPPDEAMLDALKKSEEAVFAGRYGGRSGSSTMTNERVMSHEADTYREEMAKEHPDWNTKQLDEARAKRLGELRTQSAGVTGAGVDKLRALVNKVDDFKIIEEKVEGLLASKKGLTGVAGTILRPAESVSNILGSGSTEEHQFYRYIQMLKDWWGQINRENVAAGRGLSAIEHRVDDIIAGTKWGDTNKNTVEAFRELMPLLDKMRSDFVSRSKGAIEDKGGGGGGATIKSKRVQPWQSDPEVD